MSPLEVMFHQIGQLKIYWIMSLLTLASVKTSNSSSLGNNGAKRALFIKKQPKRSRPRGAKSTRDFHGIKVLQKRGIERFKEHHKLLGVTRKLEGFVHRLDSVEQSQKEFALQWVALAFEQVRYRSRSVFVKRYVEKKSLSTIAWEEKIRPSEVETAIQSVLSVMSDIAQKTGMVSVTAFERFAPLPRTFEDVMKASSERAELPLTVREKTMDRLSSYSRSMMMTSRSAPYSNEGTRQFLSTYLDRLTPKKIRLFEMVYLKNDSIESAAEKLNVTIAAGRNLKSDLDREYAALRLLWPTIKNIK